MAMATTKTYRMKMRVRRNGHDDVHVVVDVRATNAWDAEVVAVRMVRRDHPEWADAYAVYAASKRRVAPA